MRVNDAMIDAVTMRASERRGLHFNASERGVLCYMYVNNKKLVKKLVFVRAWLYPIILHIHLSNHKQSVQP
jgi:hypothetical protein